MQAALIDLAQLNATISTPHYLFLNEAVRTTVESGHAADMANALSAVPGHGEAVLGSRLPPWEKPEELLAHLSQTSTYHAALASDARLSFRVLKALHQGTKLPFGQLTISTNPEIQANAYDPANFDAVRTLNQIYSALWCISCWGKLPAMEDDATNIIDLLQGHFHILYSGLMVYGAIEHSETNGGFDQRLGMEWHHIMRTFVLPLLPKTVDFAASRTQGFQEATLAVAAHPDLPITPVSGDGLERYLKLVVGLDMGLQLLQERLSNWSGQMLLDLAERAQEARIEHTTPLLGRLLAIIEGRDQRPGAA